MCSHVWGKWALEAIDWLAVFGTYPTRAKAYVRRCLKCGTAEYKR